MIGLTYRLLSAFSLPILWGLAHVRLVQKKEIPARTQERFGSPTIAHPQTPIIWIHAASNGESLSALPLIHKLTNLPSKPTILITTMTVTAAQLIQTRCAGMPVIHQFIPYDHPLWVSRFHAYWQPDMAIWIESEIWPNHINTLKKYNVPAVLMNARLSDNSLKNWSKAKAWFQSILSSFDVILAQTERDKNNLENLEIPHVQVLGNLKDFAPALPHNQTDAEILKQAIGNRPTVLFASTHAPEEEMAIRIHDKLKKDYPNLLSIIVPRHPKRGGEIADMAEHTVRRANGDAIIDTTEFYIADTLGELGLFYRLCPIAFVGNSMGTKPGGGHNLLEPAWFNCAILSGDDLHNFSTQAKEMPKEKACAIVKTEAALLKKIKDLLNNPAQREEMAANAFAYVSERQKDGIDILFNAIEPTCQKAALL